MTDDLPQLVQRARYRLTVCRDDLTDDAQDDCAVIVDLLAALDTLTRALAESQEAHRREGNEWVEAMFDTTIEMDRLRESLTAMTQERDEAQAEDTRKLLLLTVANHERDEALALAARQSVALTEMGDKYSDEFNRAESLTTAVREARAETWASAIGAVEALGESGFFNYAKEQLKAARAAQP